ncbi:response regulator [Massilia sp. RP-1-19]|uniref:Response regulator n=1 Tax=Massilia polaris TaxID=2728846 RepID=A0A848HNT1_9BURK|nr:response regulator [Massilia polaris]NML60933.1 response regulator [Massilia polaris]
MRQASPSELATGAAATATCDWQATQLGARAGWPYALRLSVDILLNTPLPMLLAWGDGPVVVFNDAYGRLAGAIAPGARAGAPTAPLDACPDAWQRARAGETVRLARQVITFSHADGDHQQAFDVRLTPLRDEHDAVAGVLCALGDCAIDEGEAVGTAPPGRLRILVVEDNLDSQYLVCEMLKAFGHHADGVGDAEAALGMLDAAGYDVLFSDVSLPGMSGVELARQGLLLQPSMHIIFASGYGDALLRHLSFPFVSLQKPYEMEQLQGTLDELARRLGR